MRKRKTVGPTTYVYNNMDRMTSRTDPLTRAESYQYDGNGNLTQFTDRRGKIDGFTYDALNRRTFVGFGSSKKGWESTINYTYDAGSRLAQLVDSTGGTITRTYDNFDRLASETTPQGSISYGYDAAGRRASMAVAGQQTVNYSYDNADRLTQMTQLTTVVGFSYDAASRRTLLTLPNGVTVGYGYDDASRLTSMIYQLGQTQLGNVTYTYDNAGRVAAKGGTWVRTNLPAVVSSATYDAANELTNWGGTSMSYDANGNISSPAQHVSYTWNVRNQLTSVPGATFQYDGFGRRQVRGTTSFLYDGLNPVQELSGSTPTANTLAGGLDEFFMRTDSAGARSLLPDLLGSTVALADNAGTVQTQYTYEPFGNTTFTGASSASPFQFTGRENDGTGLHYYRARYYSPLYQRFISQDPIGFRGGINPYVYAGNDPVMLGDPFGLKPRRRRGQPYPPDPSGSPCGGPCVPVNPDTPFPFYVEATEVDLGTIEAADPFTAEGLAHPDPDFLQLTLNVGGLVGATLSFTLTRGVHLYAGPGLNVGKSATIVSGSFTPGWMRPSPASESSVGNFVRGWSCSGGGGFIYGYFFNFGSGGQAHAPGAATPQVGLSCTYGLLVF
jgi:RHS repeat-associated protein